MKEQVKTGMKERQNKEKRDGMKEEWKTRRNSHNNLFPPYLEIPHERTSSKRSAVSQEWETVI